ncbi:MAG: sulfatase [Pirellulaceae bacterium]
MKDFYRKKARRLRGLLLVLVFACASSSSAAERPNVVLFMVDDMGWMDSEPYGSRYYETPNMTRLARQSMRLTDAYAVPLCSPTRATILSGQYSARHGVTSASGHRPAAPADAARYPASAPPTSQFIYPLSKNYLDPEITTLAEVLRKAGYRTGHFGKWHLGVAPEHRPDQHGFETTWFCVPDPGPPSYFSPYGVEQQGRPTGGQRVGNITDGPAGEYITDRLTDEALAFIETHQDEPFFLNLWQYGVHGPWGHKEAYTAEFAKKTDPRGEQRNPIMASMLKSVDQSLGRVLDKLDELGLSENTVFIFYSDNGGNTHSNTLDDSKLANLPPNHPKQAFVKDWRKWAGGEPPTNNAPLREGKGRIYEGGQRVPLMVRWPTRIEAGGTCDAVVGPIDLYPTILDALDVDRPAEHLLDGESILPVLQGSGGLEREALFTWFPHLIPAVSVRSGDWKLIRRWEPHRDYPAVRELYNLKADLGETNNLAADMPDKVAKLEALIDAFIKDTGALVPTPNPAYRESAAKAARAADAGLVPKFSKATLIDGALRVERDGRLPFLGTAQVRNLSGPLTLNLRLKGPAGKAQVRWKGANQETFPEDAQTVDYVLADREGWQEVKIDLPVKGRPGIVRIYLPLADDAPIDIESIEFTDRQGGKKAWSFSHSKAAVQ